ncbi:MAG: ABC transporter permease [Thalassobaculales bacterium]
MSGADILIQFLNGLAGASSLFLVAAGLSLIFGVTRIVNFAHGSFFMLGVYIAYSAIQGLYGLLGRTPEAFWLGVAAGAIAVALIGRLVEMLLLRRIYRAPELFQLLATFGLVLVIKDACLLVWGAEDLVGPRAPGLRGAVDIGGRLFPEYDLLLIAVGPLVLLALWLILTRTRWGTLIRAATEDREMLAALGVDQKRLFTGLFTLGAFLAGLGGAIQVPREPANLMLDITVIADAFVVVVVGGMGSIPGAFLAALLISEVKAFCVALGEQVVFGVPVSFTRLTLVVEFIVMAVVLVVRPWGLLGRPEAAPRGAQHAPAPLPPPGRWFWRANFAVLAVLFVLPLGVSGYTLVLLTDMLVFALFAASLQFLLGPAGTVSFGHAAYFGMGCYAAGLLTKSALVPMEAALALAPLAAGAGALVFGWFCVRLSGVYFAMLTLAFAQIAWSVVYQWDGLTGGSNGLVGIWPAAWLAHKTAYYWLTLATCGAGILALWRIVHSPFGYALRAGRDSPLRADAVGIDVKRQQWFAFALAGIFAGLAGAVYAFSKGSISPEAVAIPRSVDALVMVLLGGVQTLTGGVAGAAVLIWLQDELARQVDYWRAFLGLTILFLVLAFPRGLVGSFAGGLAALSRRRE